MPRSSRATSSATSPGRRRGRLSRHRPACARPAPRALRDRAREGLIRSSPATGVRLPATEAVEDEEQAKALTEAELGRVLLAAAPEWRLLVRLLADTGLRVGEAIALKWGDLDLGRRRLHVRQRFYKGDFAPPKSRYGRRAVPLSPDLARELWRARKAAGAGDGAFVFPGRGGDVLNASTAYRAVQAAGEAAGGPGSDRTRCATRARASSARA